MMEPRPSRPSIPFGGGRDPLNTTTIAQRQRGPARRPLRPRRAGTTTVSVPAFSPLPAGRASQRRRTGTQGDRTERRRTWQRGRSSFPCHAIPLTANGIYQFGYQRQVDHTSEENESQNDAEARNVPVAGPRYPLIDGQSRRLNQQNDTDYWKDVEREEQALPGHLNQQE